MPTAAQKLAKALMQKRFPIDDILFGTILSYTASTATTATVLTCDFEGSGAITHCITGDTFAALSPAPAVGDVVIALSVGPDVYVIDRLA